jgi:transcriptional regulator with XRE-family HTH domain
MNAARVLRRARRAAGLSQRGLAARSGIAQPAIARIESGAAKPRVDTLDRLLAACGVDLELARRLGAGVDRSQIRALLRLDPAERLRLATQEARNLDLLLGSP